MPQPPHGAAATFLSTKLVFPLNKPISVCQDSITMFFRVPTSPKATATALDRPSKVPKLSAPDDLDSSGYYRRRVPTAYAPNHAPSPVACANNDDDAGVIVAD